MIEFAQVWPAMVGIIIAAFVAWIVSREKISRHQCDELCREIAKEAVKPFTGGLQMIEDQWHETFDRLRLQEHRIAARLKKEEKMIANRDEGAEVADIFRGAKPAEAGKNVAESNGNRQAQREDMLKKHLSK